MSIHTPGPWFASFGVHGDPIICTDINRPAFTCIAVIDKSEDYGKSNAEFIATAPDMEFRIKELEAQRDSFIAESSKWIIECKRLRSINGELVERFNKIITKMGESECTCAGEDDGYEPCGCNYHDLVEALAHAQESTPSPASDGWEYAEYHSNWRRKVESRGYAYMSKNDEDSEGKYTDEEMINAHWERRPVRADESNGGEG